MSETVIELPENVVAAFGEGDDALRAAVWLVVMEEEIYARFEKHPVYLTAGQLREVFGCVVH